MKTVSVVLVRKRPKTGACSARGSYARLLPGRAEVKGKAVGRRKMDENCASSTREEGTQNKRN